jgi:hypothetical protein
MTATVTLLSETAITPSNKSAAAPPKDDDNVEVELLGVGPSSVELQG